MFSFELFSNILKYLAIIGVGTISYYGLIVIKLYVNQQRQAKKLAWVPGPKPQSLIFGNMKIYQDEKGQLNSVKSVKVLTSVAAQYGPLFKMQFGPANLVYLTRANHVEKLLSSSKLIEKSRRYGALKEWLGNGLLTSGGDLWRHHRKLLTPAFHFSVLDDYLIVMNDKSMLLRDKLAKKGHEDTFSLVITCMLEVVMEAIMGLELDQDQDTNDIPYIKAIKQYTELSLERFFNPLYSIPIYLRNSNYGRKYLAAIDTMKQFTDQIIKKRVNQSMTNGYSEDSIKSSKKRKAFLDLLIDLLKDGKLSTEEIREQIDTITFAGHDTTATAVTYALYQIGRHPDVQANVHRELDEIFDCDRNRALDKEDIRRMSYLEAVLKESMRILPSAPLIGRLVTDDLEIDGHIIPRGVQAIVPIFLLHRDPVEFPEPDKFVPERFMADSPIADKYPNKRSSAFAYVPFSAGPRSCIGQRFALLEAKVSLANILRKYRIESLDKPDDLQLGIELVLRPKCPIRIKFTERD